MSLYNMLFGYNPATFVILPMLGRKIREYPRFRDCFVSEDNNNIVVYTRVGGGNRNTGYGEEELYKDPHFIKTYDDDFDNTFGCYEFSVPERWQKDFELIVEKGNLWAVSNDYLEYLMKFYEDKPKIVEQISNILETRKNGECDVNGTGGNNDT